MWLMLALLIIYSVHKLKKHLVAFYESLSADNEIKINTSRFNLIIIAYVSRFIILFMTTIADILMLRLDLKHKQGNYSKEDFNYLVTFEVFYILCWISDALNVALTCYFSLLFSREKLCTQREFLMVFDQEQADQAKIAIQRAHEQQMLKQSALRR